MASILLRAFLEAQHEVVHDVLTDWIGNGSHLLPDGFLEFHDRSGFLCVHSVLKIAPKKKSLGGLGPGYRVPTPNQSWDWSLGLQSSLSANLGTDLRCENLLRLARTRTCSWATGRRSGAHSWRFWGPPLIAPRWLSLLSQILRWTLVWWCLWLRLQPTPCT